MNMVWHPVELYVENLDLIIDVTGVQISVYSKEKKMLKKKPKNTFFGFQTSVAPVKYQQL